MMLTTLQPRTLLFGLLGAVVFALPVRAHPFSVLEVELRVERERVEADLIVTVEDFYWAFELPADEEGRLDPGDVTQSVERYKTVAMEELILSDVDEKRLRAKVMGVRPLGEATWESLADSMKNRVAYTLEFPLGLPPIGLTFSHFFGGQRSVFPSIVKLRVIQSGHPPQPLRLIEKGDVATLIFDWLTPPPSANGPDSTKEPADREAALGIESYGAVYSFCYIEDHEVRHEILIPLATLETWMDVARAKPSVLTVVEQEAVRDRLFEFFSSYNPVSIDGIEVKPLLKKLRFFDLDIRDFAEDAPPRPVPAYAARMGMILSYPANTPPQVTLGWDLFSRSVLELRMVLLTEDRAQSVTLTRASPNFEWTRPGEIAFPRLEELAAPALTTAISLPWLSLPLILLGGIRFLVVCFGGFSLKKILIPVFVLVVAACAWPVFRIETPFAIAKDRSESEAREIFRVLHGNIYRAFDHHEEGKIYDSLRESVAGDLLADLYLLFRRGLEMREQGGAISKVELVTLGESRLIDQGLEGEDDRSFRMVCDWTVEGTVEHWGHVHSRTNRFEATASVSPVDETWKIIRFDVTNQERVKFVTSVREVP